MHVILPDDLTQFVHDQLVAGRYPSAADVVGEGLRLLRQQEELRAAIAVGSAEADRGGLAPLRAGDILAELRQRRSQ